MEEQAAKATECTKRLCALLAQTQPPCEQHHEACQALLKDIRHAVRGVCRYALDERAQATVREALLRQAMHEDMTDRDAHQARILDRQRLLVESDSSSSATFERALRATTSVEATLADLYPHFREHGTGMALLFDEGQHAHTEERHCAV